MILNINTNIGTLRERLGIYQYIVFFACLFSVKRMRFVLFASYTCKLVSHSRKRVLPLVAPLKKKKKNNTACTIQQAQPAKPASARNSRIDLFKLETCSKSLTA
jgi:hypothetical protein